MCSFLYIDRIYVIELNYSGFTIVSTEPKGDQMKYKGLLFTAFLLLIFFAIGDNDDSGEMVYVSPYPVQTIDEFLGSSIEPDADYIIGSNRNYLCNSSMQEMTYYNNPEATDVSYDDLKQFLLSDKTDRNIYTPGSYVCIDYAKELHDNAERQGIRSAIVSVDLKQSNGSIDHHALNAFNTTDRGMVYIDTTGHINSPGIDTIVYDFGIGKQYIPKTVFNSRYVHFSMGEIVDYDVIW